MKRVHYGLFGPQGEADRHGMKPDGVHEYGRAFYEERDNVICRAAWYLLDTWDEPEMRYMFGIPDPIMPSRAVDITPPEWANEWLDKADGILTKSYEKFLAYRLDECKPIPIIEASE